MLAFLERLKASPHRWCQDNLSAYIDGELSPRDHERVQQHLEQCPACQRELAALERTVALLRRMPVVKAPRPFYVPSTAPLPSLPVWMRPWAYGALRMATAAVAVLFVVTVAGNALAAPSLLAGQAPPVVPMEGYGQAEVATEDATAAASRSVGIAQGATPEDVEVLTAPAPAATPDLPAAVPPGEPTLTPEEEARRAAAPDGKGGGVLPGDAPQPAPPVGEATHPVETPEPVAAAAPVAGTPPAAEAPGAEPIQAAGAEDVARAGEPPAVHESYALTGLEEARLRLARYPWPMWSALTAALLAVLAAALLWLRSARARWP